MAALLVLDMQRDFLEADGRNPIPPGDVPALIEAANASIAGAARNGMEIVYAVNEFERRDWKNVFRRFAAIAGTSGSEMDPRITMASANRFSKSAGDAFSNPDLHRFLGGRGVGHVYICGVYADQCVAATVAGARRRGYEVSVIGDAVATSSHRKLVRVLAKYQASGVGVVNSAFSMR